jgi:hypothetical protein
MRYAIGQRWRCERDSRPTFDFVIVGPGEKPGSKRCRLDVDPNWFRRQGYVEVSIPGLMARAGHGQEQDYSHKHLKKHAKLVAP